MSIGEMEDDDEESANMNMDFTELVETEMSAWSHMTGCTDSREFNISCSVEC